MTNRRVKEYPVMNYFGIPRHTWLIKAYMMMTEYFWEFLLEIALWECY